MVFFLFAFNLYSGVHSVDPALVSAVRLLGGPGPGAAEGALAGLPALAAGQPSHWLGLALSGAIVGEYLGSTQGMGWLLSAAGMCTTPSGCCACVLVLVVLIILLDGGGPPAGAPVFALAVNFRSFPPPGGDDRTYPPNDRKGV